MEVGPNVASPVPDVPYIRPGGSRLSGDGVSGIGWERRRGRTRQAARGEDVVGGFPGRPSSQWGASRVKGTIRRRLPRRDDDGARPTAVIIIADRRRSMTMIMMMTRLHSATAIISVTGEWQATVGVALEGNKTPGSNGAKLPKEGQERIVQSVT